MAEDTKKPEKEKKKRKKYIKPKINSEELISFGSVCNGTTIGGRKESTGAPKFCNSARLLS